MIVMALQPTHSKELIDTRAKIYNDDEVFYRKFCCMYFAAT